MKILVVDDDERMLKVVRLVLQMRGHTVQTVSDGHRALEAMAHQAIDLLISDVAMPVMTGPDLAATVRRLYPGTPVLLMSGSERPGGYPFIAKPFHAHGLLAAVDSATARPPRDVRATA